MGQDWEMFVGLLAVIFDDRIGVLLSFLMVNMDETNSGCLYECNSVTNG